MSLTGAVVALAVLCALAILVVIPILAVLFYRKRRQARELQSRLRDYEQSQTLSIKKSSNVYSLPCRLKKKPSSAGGSRSAAGESGVYDMAELSQLSEIFTKQQVMANYPNSSGELQRLFLFGELCGDDALVVKEIISSHLEHQQSSQHLLSPVIAEDSLAEVKSQRGSLALDDVIICGLEPTTSFSFENEGYRKEEYDTATGSHKRRNQVKKTLSALSNKVRLNIRSNDKPISKLSDLGSLRSCSSYTTYRSAIIGQSGGEMILASGVKLTVPPNALHEKVEVILGVTFDPKHMPKLAEDEAMLTPIVFCQPSGTEFKLPATLTIPHCATQVQENWRINILASQTDVECTDTEWKVLQIGDYESRTFNKHEVQLCVNHFTMYCVAGTTKDKRTALKRKKLIALSTEQEPSTFSVYCVNSYHQKNGHQSGTDSCPSVLSVEANRQSIKLLVESLPEGSTSSPSSPQQISYTEAWHDTLNPVTFTLQAKDTTHDLTCDLCGWQIGNTSHKYKISLTSMYNKSQMSNGVTANGRKRGVFSESLKWDIILLLDQVHPEGNDWRKMATELGLSSDAIKTMEESASPSKELLKIWEGHSHGCVKSFVAMAVKIHRLDVAEKIEEHIGKLYLETLPNHKCDDHC